MSFLKKLFGGGASKPAAMPSEMHDGFVITPAPMSDGGQFRLCAEIRKEIDGEMKTHTLIRADMFPSADQAAQASISKAKQMIQEQGDRIFK
ncbi:MAG: HlyU family transcriptional regulator [Salaquimonas sp.]